MLFGSVFKIESQRHHVFFSPFSIDNKTKMSWYGDTIWIDNGVQHKVSYQASVGDMDTELLREQ